MAHTGLGSQAGLEIGGTYLERVEVDGEHGCGGAAKAEGGSVDRGRAGAQGAQAGCQGVCQPPGRSFWLPTLSRQQGAGKLVLFRH